MAENKCSVIIEKFFRVKESGSSVSTEIRSGCVTCMTRCYIIFVQRAVLGSPPPRGAGMDPGAVTVVTCIVSAIGTLIMGLVANYPIALAPCMGENFFFVTVAGMTVGGRILGWQTALGAVFISGIFFLLLSFFKFREAVFDSIPDSLKHAIAAGIGAFITLIGFQRAGIILIHPQKGLSLGDLTAPCTLLAIGGLIFTSILLARKVKGAFLWGILVTGGFGLIITYITPFAGTEIRIIEYKGLVSLPPSISPLLFKFDLKSLVNLAMFPVIMVFLIMVLFDTVGTLVGVGTQAGFLRNGKLPRIGRALVADAASTTIGAIMGSSTVSSYIESAAGVAEGGRTGLSNIITSILFIVAIFFSPLIEMIGGGQGEGGMYLPAVAPVMILVGSLMIKSIAQISWNQPDEAIPSFLVLVGIPFSYNIAYGIGFGFISYCVLKLASGKAGEVKWLCWVMAIVFIIYFGFLRE